MLKRKIEKMCFDLEQAPNDLFKESRDGVLLVVYSPGITVYPIHVSGGEVWAFRNAVASLDVGQNPKPRRH